MEGFFKLKGFWMRIEHINTVTDVREWDGVFSIGIGPHVETFQTKQEAQDFLVELHGAMRKDYEKRNS